MSNALVRKKYLCTTDYEKFFEITNIKEFMEKVEDYTKEIIYTTTYSAIKVFEIFNKSIEDGVMMGDKQDIVDITTLQNTYSYMKEWYMCNYNKADYEALENECMVEYANKNMEIIKTFTESPNMRVI
jgi:hypothetical protein